MDRKKKLILFFSFFIIFSVFLPSCNSYQRIHIEPRFFGYIENENGPVADALVKVQATDFHTYSDSEGFFDFNPPISGPRVILTAWSEGHYVGWIEAAKTFLPLKISLRRHYLSDNPDYNWFSHEGASGSLSCSHCMPSYDEWIKDAHSQSAVNPRFFSMYNGTDLAGNQSPLTQYSFSPDYGSYPMPANTSNTYFGPGYKLDFPGTSGNCSACHVPGQAAYPGKSYSADPNLASGIEKEGVFCEFCHKIGGVTIDPETGLPNENMPGVLSIQLLRPEGDEQLFFGNFDDVNRRVSYHPLYEDSAYCAPCHFGSFWNTPVYNSYGEWLDSRYSSPEDGQTCQDCHMPEVDYNYFVFPEQGGLIRNTGNIYSHLMPGAADEMLLENSLSMFIKASRDNEFLRLRVHVVNDRTGHDVPTDYPLRQVIMLVAATDDDGNPLEMTEGEQIPFYGGIGDPADGYYAGLPGKIYMKVLKELWTQVYPSGAYWNPTVILSDNRLSPDEEDVAEFTFASGSADQIKLEVKLIYRRAIKELMDQKDWDVDDILMESEILYLD